MFETAELGHSVTKQEFDERAPVLRQRLLEAQAALVGSDLSAIVVLAGVDGAGKGSAANLLQWWMDARLIVTRAYGRPTTEERERPEYWRFWRDLPANGHLGIFLSAWYSKPLLQRAYGRIDDYQLDHQLERIVSFERTLADHGAVILKFWMHLGRAQQEERLRTLEEDPETAWRVTPRDWEHSRMYDQFVTTAERLITRTSVGRAPWRIVEGVDDRYRSLELGARVNAGIRRALKQKDEVARAEAQPVDPDEMVDDSIDLLPSSDRATVLSTLDMTQTLSKSEYNSELTTLQERLSRLQRRARAIGHSLILVFEGWDAAGKGGAIRRISAALDARSHRVIRIAAPTDEERAHHYLWRFWRRLPRAGRVTIFDRSWYGRVLVERVEGFATESEWQRAYAEINDFERELVDDGTTLVKFWLHVTEDEQAQRFEERKKVPYKRWKLTEEDWRNRSKREAYEVAVSEMIERTSSGRSPWFLIEGDDKRYARVAVLRAVCAHLEEVLAGLSTEEDDASVSLVDDSRRDVRGVSSAE